MNLAALGRAGVGQAALAALALEETPRFVAEEKKVVVFRSIVTPGARIGTYFEKTARC